jgi:hypothetical protein
MMGRLKSEQAQLFYQFRLIDGSIGQTYIARSFSFRCGSDISPRKCPWHRIGGWTNMA